MAIGMLTNITAVLEVSENVVFKSINVIGTQFSDFEDHLMDWRLSQGILCQEKAHSKYWISDR
jgi:hypothetical protein